jgi:hypothetical protein
MADNQEQEGKMEQPKDGIPESHHAETYQVPKDYLPYEVSLSKLLEIELTCSQKSPQEAAH